MSDHEPVEGGSYIRNADGTLTRQNAEPDNVITDTAATVSEAETLKPE